MEQSLDFLAQPLLDNGLRAELETMEHYRETIFRAEHAPELVRSAKLIDIIAQEERHEVDLKNALVLG
jgi:bacterioferritin